MLNILIIGASGQLGQVLRSSVPASIQKNKINLLCPNKDELDITNSSSCEEYIKKYSPNYVINSAAYTKVDQAEKEFEKAHLINGKSLNYLSKNLLNYGGKLIQISTDAIFHSNKKEFFKPNSIPNPINKYGLSKLEGEENIRKILFKSNQAYIIRTSWLMVHTGTNFLKTMVNLHKTRNHLKIVYDQSGFLTTSSSLASFCWELIKKDTNGKTMPKILHWCDEGQTSWFEIASHIGYRGEKIGLFNKKASLEKVNLANYPALAPRGLYSLLDSSESIKKLEIKPKNWKDVLDFEMDLLKKKMLKNKI